MTADISFDIAWEQGTVGDPLESATFGSLAIRLGAVSLTAVHDEAARTTREVIRVSAYPLAGWLASGWWRLRWEGKRPGTDWRLTHHLGGAGGGYVWPDVTLMSDGELIDVQAKRSNKVDWEPIAYLNVIHESISASQFEVAAANFINTVVARLSEMGHSDSPLSELWATLQSERLDPTVVGKRRLEAQLGFDAEQAPLSLLSAYDDGARRFGFEAVTELAAAATNGEAPNWDALSHSLDGGREIHIGEYEDARSQAQLAAQSLPYPWLRGEQAAQAVRRVLGSPRGPLTDDALTHWLGADLAADDLAHAPAAHAGRSQADAPDLRYCYRSTHPDGRRFEVMRLIGDHLIAASPEDTLLPATRAKTARQSVQRAFAAEILLPWEDLTEGVGDDPTDETIESTAREYRVSPLVVRTRLVNKGVISADALYRENL